MRSRGVIKLSRETMIVRPQYSCGKKGPLSHRRFLARSFAVLPLDGRRRGRMKMFAGTE